MKVQTGKDRIYLIMENEKDDQLISTIFGDRQVSVWFTMDAGESGCENAIVFTRSNISNHPLNLKISDRNGEIY